MSGPQFGVVYTCKACHSQTWQPFYRFTEWQECRDWLCSACLTRKYAALASPEAGDGEIVASKVAPF